MMSDQRDEDEGLDAENLESLLVDDTVLTDDDAPEVDEERSKVLHADPISHQ